MRIPENEMPAPFRPGIWCKITGLKQNTEMNDMIVEVTDTKIGDEGTVEIRWDKTEFSIKPETLRPIEGSEKIADFHKGVPKVDWRIKE